MRILYFSQFYQPESIAAAFRAKEHATIWAEMGNDITVFTGWPNYPTGHLFEGYRMVPLGEEVIDGVRVLRSKSAIRPNTSIAKRLEAGVSYALNGLRNVRRDQELKSGDYDVVLVTCGTVFSAWVGWRYARRHRLPLVVEFRDITWKQMVATGSSETSLKVRAMKRLELSFCKEAAAVVALTKGFARTFEEEGVPTRIISVVPNGADIVPCVHSWGKEGLRLGYYGTMGLSQDVPRTLRIAKELNGEGLVSSYELIGEGASRGAVQEAIDSGGYPFVTLSHGIPKDELEAHYANVDMTVVSLQDDPSFSGTVPSKIFQSLARGVPVLFMGPEGSAADLVRESGGGLALTESNDEALAELQKFASAPDLANRLQAMSDAAVAFMEANYTRRRMAEQMLRVFEEAIRRACR